MGRPPFLCLGPKRSAFPSAEIDAQMMLRMFALGSERDELFVGAEGVLDDIVIALPGSQENQEFPEAP